MLPVGGDPERWSYLWNAASGAGHGQNWFGMEGYDVELGEEYEPGHYRTTRIPDGSYITEVMEAAADTSVENVPVARPVRLRRADADDRRSKGCPLADAEEGLTRRCARILVPEEFADPLKFVGVDLDPWPSSWHCTM